jgi:hypothetical protein
LGTGISCSHAQSDANCREFALMYALHRANVQVADNEKHSIGSAPAEERVVNGMVGPEYFR